MKKASAHFMKNTKWVGLVTVLAFPLLSAYGQTPEAAIPGAPGQAQAAVGANLSPGAAEVVRLAGSGVGDDVVLAYIQNSQAPFNLSADNVLYLKDVGLSPQVTSAMLSHDSTLRGQPQQYAPAAAAPMAPAPAAPAPAAPAHRDASSGATARHRSAAGLCHQSAGRRELLLQRSFALWHLGLPGRLRLVLATARGCDFPRLAALLRWRLLGLHRRRVVLAIHLFLGLGAVPLWPLVCAPALRLGLAAGPSLGAGLGNLAGRRRQLRLGAAAAARRHST